MVKNPPANAGDVRHTGSIPRLERFSGGGNGNPLQYSSLENPLERGVWGATVHRVADSGLSTHVVWLHLEGVEEGVEVQPPAATGGQQRQPVRGVSPHGTEVETDWSEVLQRQLAAPYLLHHLPSELCSSEEVLVASWFVSMVVPEEHCRELERQTILYFFKSYQYIWGFPGGSVEKNMPANAGDKSGFNQTRVWFLVWEDATCHGATKPHMPWKRGLPCWLSQ